MMPPSASISPRMPRTLRKSPDPAPKSAAFGACMRGWMSSVRQGDLQLRNKFRRRGQSELLPIDPEPLIRMLIVGYGYGVAAGTASERLREKVDCWAGR